MGKRMVARFDTPSTKDCMGEITKSTAKGIHDKYGMSYHASFKTLHMLCKKSPIRRFNSTPSFSSDRHKKTGTLTLEVIQRNQNDLPVDSTASFSAVRIIIQIT